MSYRQPVRAIDPICSECGKMAKAMDGTAMWGASAHDPHATFWKCECGAWAPSHRGSDIPLGFPGHRRLRDDRQRAQKAFDKIIDTKRALNKKLSKAKAKEAGVAWLCEQLSIAPDDAHPWHMDKATIARMLALVEPLAARMVEVELEAMRRRRAAEASQEAF